MKIFRFKLVIIVNCEYIIMCRNEDITILEKEKIKNKKNKKMWTRL